jgi:RNA polymerase sigma-70 factor (ECF subfamily)
MTNFEFNSTLLGLKPKLLSFAMSLTPDREKARDLIQDTYFKALTSRNSFVDFGNLKAWVFTIMKNTFINNYRCKVRENFIFDNIQDLFYINQSHDNGYISPESTYAKKEIEIFIDSLRDEFKIPFRMVLKGYKYHEISEKLGLNIGTVKSRIFLSRQKLKLMLKDHTG